jgi:hypothetical protein
MAACTRSAPNRDVPADAAPAPPASVAEVQSAPWASVNLVLWAWTDQHRALIRPDGSVVYTAPAGRDASARETIGQLRPEELDVVRKAAAWLAQDTKRTWSAHTSSDSGFVVELVAPARGTPLPSSAEPSGGAIPALHSLAIALRTRFEPGLARPR